MADGPEQHQIINKQFVLCLSKCNSLEKRLRQSSHSQRQLNDEQIQAGLDYLRNLVSNSQEDLSNDAIGRTLQETNTRLFFRFKGIQKNNRRINEIAGGQVTFGNAVPPITLYQGRTSKKEHQLTASTDAGKTQQNKDTNGQEGGSLGNVSRGDRIRTCDVLVPNQVL